MIFIQSLAAAWVILLFWGLFRNAPFPVVYALLVDSAPKAAGTALGIMIGVALGVSGLFASAVSGIVITHLGFNWHYVILAGICLLGLDRKSTRLNSSHVAITYAVFCLT